MCFTKCLYILQDNAGGALEQLCESPWVDEPDLNPIEHLWRDMEMVVHQWAPCNRTELERICIEEWQKIPQIQVCKAFSVIPQKYLGRNQCSSSTKFWLKGLNFYVIFQFCVSDTFAYISKILFSLCHYGVLGANWWRKKLLKLF